MNPTRGIALKIASVAVFMMVDKGLDTAHPRAEAEGHLDECRT